MKTTNKQNPITWIAIILALLAICTLFSCRTSKSFQLKRDTTEEASKKTVDSLRRVIATKDSLHSKEVSQLKETGVVFKDRPVYVPVKIPDNASVDSLRRIIQDQAELLASMENEVQIMSDGSIKAKGQLQSAFFTSSQKDKEITRLRSQIDSLTQVKIVDTAGKKTENFTGVQIVKRGWGLWPWILLLAGFVGGCAFWKNRKRILSLFKFIKMKIFVFFFLCMLALTGCSTYHDEPIVSVWSAGNWLLFWVPFLGSLPFFYFAWLASKSQSKQQSYTGTSYYKKNVPIYKTGQFWFGAVLVLVSIGVIIFFNSNWHR